MSQLRKSSLTPSHSASIPEFLHKSLRNNVLRVPGEVCVGFDAVAGPMFRRLHVFDTMVVIDPSTFPMRLASAGFTDIAIDVRARGFRFRARRTRHCHGLIVCRRTEPT